MKFNFDVEPGGVMGNISQGCDQPVGPIYDGKHASIPSIKTTPANYEANVNKITKIKTNWEALTQAFLNQSLNGGDVTGFLGF